MGLAALYSVIASVFVFAQYAWYGDRFLWPTLALLTPALAITVDAAGRALRRYPGLRAPTVAGFSVAAMVVASRGSGLSNLELEGALRLAAGASLSGSLAFAGTAATRSVGSRELAVLAPLILCTLPGALDRLAVPSADLGFSVLVTASLATRRGLLALGFALAAGVVALTAEALPPGDWWRAPTPIVLGVAAAVTVPILGRGAWPLSPLVLLFVPRIASLGAGDAPLFALVCACLVLPAPLEMAGSAAARSWRRLGGSQRLLLLATIAGALFLTGAARRIEQPFRIASYEGVRRAVVHSGETACDFLAWEHLNWECATLDRGVHGETGLATSAPLHVAARPAEMFLITASPRRPRTVRWTGVATGHELVLRVALPDELPSSGALEVAFDERVVTRIELDALAPGRIHDHVIRVPAQSTDLVLTLRGSAVLVDGRFRGE